MLAVFGDWRQLKGGQKQAAFDRVIEYEQFTDEVTWGSTVRLLVLGSLDLPKQRLETVSFDWVLWSPTSVVQNL